MIADVKITGNYGTFEVSKVVTIVSPTDMTTQDIIDEAYPHTGIMLDLERGGWTVTSPDGEDWEYHVTIRPATAG